VDFVVWPGCRRRVLETGRKMVHAFAVGTLGTGEIPSLGINGFTPVTYNPRLHETFIRCDSGEPVYCAASVILDDDGKAYAKLPQAKLKTITFLLQHRKAILSPKNWCELLDVKIFDPDGWRKDDKDFEAIIGQEFLERLSWSTIRF